MEKMSIADCRDKLLMNSTKCHSKYKKRKKDRCNYCEVDFGPGDCNAPVGMICPFTEEYWREMIGEDFPEIPKSRLDDLNIFTVAAVYNCISYVEYFGKETLVEELKRDFYFRYYVKDEKIEATMNWGEEAEAQ